MPNRISETGFWERSTRGALLLRRAKGDTAASSLKTPCVPARRGWHSEKVTVRVHRGRDQLLDVLLMGRWRGQRGQRRQPAGPAGLRPARGGQLSAGSSAAPPPGGVSDCRTARGAACGPCCGTRVPRRRCAFSRLFLSGPRPCSLELPTGARGRSWRRTEAAAYRQRTSRAHGKAWRPGAPQRPAWHPQWALCLGASGQKHPAKLLPCFEMSAIHLIGILGRLK